MFRKKSFWIGVLVIILAAAGGGYYYFNTTYLLAQAAVETETLQTAKVRRGDLIVSASSTGRLVPVQEAAVGFRNGDTLVELNVRPGDVVRTEQVLARLDDTEARAQLAQTETNLRLAQHKLDEADTIAAQAEANLQLAELKLDQADNAIAQAEANLRLAELKLDTLLAGPDSSALAVVQANLDSVQTELESLLAGPTDDEIAVAAVDMEQAVVALKQAQAVYDTIAWADDVGASPQAAALQTASLAYEKSLATYRQKVAGATPDQIATVQAKLTQAQQQYDDLLAGAETNDIAAAQIAVEQAQAVLETARDIAALEIGVKQARAALAVARDTTASEIGVEQAQLAVDTARHSLESLALPAPFAGSVTEVNAVVGEAVGTTSIVTLFNSSRAEIELYLDETDMDKLAVGNEVEVVFDALPDLTLTGQIIRINASLVVVDGVPVISALAELEEPEIVEPSAFSDGNASPLPQVKLMPGMNASVEVIAGRAQLYTCACMLEVRTTDA